METARRKSRIGNATQEEHRLAGRLCSGHHGLFRRGGGPRSGSAGNPAFIIGTTATLLCVAANRLRWFSTDKTYGAVATTRLVIILVNCYERLTGTKKGDPAPMKC